jgi:hypothetical protein
MMKINTLDRMIGKYCKIVTKKPDENKAQVVFGLIRKIDHKTGFISIESNQGLKNLDIKIVEAIKPRSGDK